MTESPQEIWELFNIISYSELRNSRDETWRNFVVDNLMQIDPIRYTEFGENVYNAINNGAKKFSGLMASAVDYYSSRGPESFPPDKGLYEDFLIRAFNFDAQIIDEVGGYESLAIAHTAEHTADTAGIISAFMMGPGNEYEGLNWYHESIKYRKKAIDIYSRRGDDGFIKTYQAKINQGVRNLDILKMHKFPEGVIDDDPMGELEAKVIYDSAIISAELTRDREMHIALSKNAVDDIEDTDKIGLEILNRKKVFMDKHVAKDISSYSIRRIRLINNYIFMDLNIKKGKIAIRNQEFWGDLMRTHASIFSLSLTTATSIANNGSIEDLDNLNKTFELLYIINSNINALQKIDPNISKVKLRFKQLGELIEPILSELEETEKNNRQATDFLQWPVAFLRASNSISGLVRYDKKYITRKWEDLKKKK